ncbi:MAG TPA: hypothetical protein VFZ77_20475 [Acidimicrobiales bacterium]
MSRPAPVVAVRPPAPAPSRGRAARRGAERAGLAGWVLVVAAGLAWGWLAVTDAGVSLRAAPLMGRWRWQGGPALLPAIGLAVAVAARGPRLAARLPWRRLPWSAGAAATAWALALAAAGGWARVTAPLTTRHEYEPFAAGIGDIGRFLAGFAEGLPRFPVHVQGHPPGPVVLAWALDRAGLGGAGWLAALALAGWGAAVAAALVAARRVAGERAARRAAPALVLLPGAVWAGTSLDALFAGVTTAAGALAIAAAGRRSRRLAGTAGAVAGSALLLTYGAVAVLAAPAVAALVLLAAPPRDAAAPGGTGGRPPRAAATAGARPPVPVVAIAAWAAAGMAAVLGAAALAGFRWPDGLAATHRAYWSGVGGDRPGLYLTLAGNPAALALAAGPAVAAGIVTVLSRARTAWRPALLPGVALAAVALADLSQMSRGEVERIWLPFLPWLALAAPGDRRAWLAAQAGLGLALQSLLDSPW